MCVLFGIVCLFVFKTQRDIRAPKIYSHFAFRQKYSLYEHPRIFSVFSLYGQSAYLYLVGIWRGYAWTCARAVGERNVRFVGGIVFLVGVVFFNRGGRISLYNRYKSPTVNPRIRHIPPRILPPYPPVKQSTLSLSTESGVF